jgi:hypothetical protein
MSTPAPAVPATPPRTVPLEVTVYSHSSLFYWWPVWVIGYILALLTFFAPNSGLMEIAPKGSERLRKAQVTITGKDENKTLNDRNVVALAPDKDFLEPNDPHLKMSTSKGYGVIFATILLVVIFITNVPLRGMWSVMIIMAIVMLSIIFALAGYWDKILGAIKLLDIRINAGGYMFISTGLLLLWLFAFFFFDRQLYIKFVPGAMKVCLEIGAGEKQYDTIGMTIERERSDLFRHMLLGLGSGDLIVRTSGADRHEFRLNNVLAINRKLKIIEDMQRVRPDRA